MNIDDKLKKAELLDTLFSSLLEELISKLPEAKKIEVQNIYQSNDKYLPTQIWDLIMNHFGIEKVQSTLNNLIMNRYNKQVEYSKQNNFQIKSPITIQDEINELVRNIKGGSNN